MSFNFYVMGLFIIYMIMCIYFVSNKDIANNGDSAFKKLLIINFINQFLYLLSFILCNVSGKLFFKTFSIKLFIVSLIITMVLFIYYIYSKMMKNKHVGSDTRYSNSVLKMSGILSIVVIFLALVSFILPVSINGNVISGSEVNYLYFVLFSCLIVNLCLMIFNNKYIDKRDYLKLILCMILILVSLIIQLSYSKLGIIASTFTFVILFIYITMESVDAKKIRYLEVTKESAIRANASKSEFLEKLSREIRMPLNTIDGFSQVIIDEDDINTIKDDAKDIRMASNNLVNLINGIIDISLIESGDMSISNRDYDTMEMLENVSMIAKTLINKKNIDFKFEYSDNIPKVLSGDSDNIKRILINIISNAAQNTNSGEIIFKVQAVKNGSKCRLIMSVSDTGKGIAKSELNTIFNRYERVNNEKGGNGLGLAIVSSLVSLMGGKVDVDSELGKGSTFTVTIDQNIIDDTSVKVIKNDDHNVKVFDASGKRVLIVDDNKLNLKVASRLLMPYNVSVVLAGSGSEFLDIIDNDTNFDLILMDDMMPKMSGTDTLDIFKKIERVSGFSVPIVVLTANAISGMREKYLSCGFDDYLAKPIDKFELNRVLKKYLKSTDTLKKDKDVDYNDVMVVKNHKIRKRDWEA